MTRPRNEQAWFLWLVQSDARGRQVLATTELDLFAFVETSQFLPELYYHLNTVLITGTVGCRERVGT